MDVRLHSASEGAEGEEMDTGKPVALAALSYGGQGHRPQGIAQDQDSHVAYFNSERLSTLPMFQGTVAKL